MALEIALQSEKTELTMQENTVIEVILTNSGAEAIGLVDPNLSAEFPVFKVFSRESGETWTFRRKATGPRKTEIPIQLAAGKKMTWNFELLDLAEFADPGQYEMTAEYEWADGAATARSEPLTLKLSALVAQSVAMAMTQEPRQEEFYLFWTQIAGDNTQLMRTTVSNFKNPEVVETLALGTVPDHIVPVPSIAANQANPLHTWVAWMHGGRLYCRLVETNADVEEEPIAVEMPAVQIRIVSHPFILTSGEGEVVLWMGAPAAGTAKIQLAKVNPRGRSGAGSNLILPSPLESLWARTAFLGSKRRRVYLVNGGADGVALQCTEWGDDGEFADLTDLSSQTGKFVAAGLSVMPDDSINGMLVVLPEEGAEKLVFVRWTHRPDGAYDEGEAEEVAFEHAGRINEGFVRINDVGDPYVLLRPMGQPWHLRAPGEEFAPVGGDVADSQLPANLFFSAQQEPLLLGFKSGAGFFFQKPSGEPAIMPEAGW